MLVSDDAERTAALARVLAGPTEPAVVLDFCARLGDVPARLREHAPDVVVLDLELAGQDPLAAYITLHTIAPEIPVVLLASAETEAVALRVVQQGARDFVLWEQLHATYLLRTLQYAVERTRQEYELGEARARSEHFFRQAHDAVFVSTFEGRLLNANEAYRRLFGFARAELPHVETAAFYVDPADRDRFSELLQANDALKDFPVRLRHAEGEVKDCLISATLRRAPDGGPRDVQGIVREITDEKRLQAQLTQALACEQQLRAEAEHERQRTAAILESITDAFFALNGDWRFTYVNRATEMLTRPMLGLDGEALLGQHIWEVLPEMEGTEFDEQCRRALRERVPVHFTAYFAALGRWFAVRAYPSPEGLAIYFRDVTETKLTEQALHDSEASYRALFDNIAELVYILDPEGRFLNVNHAVLGAYGYTREELIGRTPAMLADPERTDVAQVLPRIRAALRGEPQSFEWWARRKNGSSFLKEIVLTRAEYFGREVVIAVARDITERKEAEFAVSRSRDYYHSLLDCLPALVWRSDAEGACAYLNASRLEFTGRTLEEESGDGWAEGLHPEDRERVLATHHAAVAAREPFEMEYRLRHQSGEHRWVLDIGRPMYDSDGAFQGLVGGAIDLHTQRQLEAKLRMAQKMEAVGRLAGGVAHDFNNLLTAITTNAALLLLDLAPGDPAREHVGEIRDATERAAALTHQLLAFSRKQVLQPRLLDLNEVLRSTDRMLRRLIPEDIVLVSELEPRLGRVRADPGQVEQVILNLAINARDAIVNGGQLAFRTRNVVVGPEQPPQPYVRPGRYVALMVQDTGSGMDDATARQIFEPFFTTKRVGEGTGLGLSTAYGIIKQSGGYIWAESEPGQGTAFTILLPREDAPATEEPSTAPAEQQPAPGGETVLLVEDEPLVRRAARRILERSGYTVLETESAMQALHLARVHTEPIHLLLTDVVMPVLGGRELAGQIVALHPEIRVLYMSGYPRGSLDPRGVLEPGTVLLEKPFSPDALARLVRQVLDGTRS